MVTLSWVDIVNFIIGTVGLVLMLMGFVLARSSHVIEPWTKKFFSRFFGLLSLYMFFVLCSNGFIALPGARLAAKISVFLESLVSSILPVMLTLLLLRFCGETWKGSKLLLTVAVLWLCYFLLLSVTQFTTGIYFFTHDGVYHRGPLYPMLLIPPELIMLVNLTAVVRRWSKLSRKQRTAFLVYLLLPTLAMLIQMWLYGLLLIVIATAVSALFMLQMILIDHMEMELRQKEELAMQRQSIAVLQMRPHFIYNTLISIYYLTDQDPEKGKQLIKDFTNYLRKNFTAIAKESTIPFTEELEHTRAYLAVEKARYEDLLYVEYDIRHTMFHIPPLTLQPIVENAVKHGMDPELDPLHVRISTFETDTGSVIRVEDTGIGFLPTDEKEPHIALANIQERLELMCGGSLKIQSPKSGGTLVEIFIPY